MEVSKILMVEGIDDKHVIKRLMERRKLSYTDDMESFINESAGLPKLLNKLPLAIEGGSYEIIGVIVDTDTDLAERWRTLRNILKHAGYQNVPDAPKAEGLILEDDELPKIGCWLMPNNHLPGNLEDFVALLIADDDTLLPIAKDTVEKLIAEGHHRFTIPKKSKAVIHTWLAWQEFPGTRLGSAITAKYAKQYIMDERKGIAFINWLQGLFKT